MNLVGLSTDDRWTAATPRHALNLGCGAANRQGRGVGPLGNQPGTLAWLSHNPAHMESGRVNRSVADFLNMEVRTAQSLDVIEGNGTA